MSCRWQRWSHHVRKNIEEKEKKREGKRRRRVPSRERREVFADLLENISHLRIKCTDSTFELSPSSPLLYLLFLYPPYFLPFPRFFHSLFSFNPRSLFLLPYFSPSYSFSFSLTSLPLPLQPFLLFSLYFSSSISILSLHYPLTLLLSLLPRESRRGRGETKGARKGRRGQRGWEGA